MIFRAIKYGLCIGIGAWTALNTYIVVNGFVKYFIKKFIASGEKKSENENKPEEKKEDTFTYKDAY